MNTAAYCPTLQINVDQLLSSYELKAFKPADRWAFLQLGMYLWKHLQQTGLGLPDDDGDLAKLADIAPRRWRAGIGARIRAMLERRADGTLVIPWVVRELEKLTEKRSSRSEVNRANAQARWTKYRGEQAEAAATGRNRTRGMEAAGSVLARAFSGGGGDVPRFPPDSEERIASHAGGMRFACDSHASDSEYKYIQHQVNEVDTDTIGAREECETDAKTHATTHTSPPLKPASEAQNVEPIGAQVDGDTIRQAQACLDTLKPYTRIAQGQKADVQIAARCLYACDGSIRELVARLTELIQRKPHKLKNAYNFAYVESILLGKNADEVRKARSA